MRQAAHCPLSHHANSRDSLPKNARIVQALSSTWFGTSRSASGSLVALHMWSPQPILGIVRRSLIGVVVPAVAGVAVVTTLSLLAGGKSTTTAPTAGKIPPAAFQGSSINLTIVPDYIAALDHLGHSVGYVAKANIMPPSPTRGQSVATPVYGADLRTVVGHMYDGEGFVPVGQLPGAHASPVTVVENAP
jgi:hypothetical protein